MPSPPLRSLGIAILISIGFVQSAQTASAQITATYDWQSPGGTLWSDASNWTPPVGGPPNAIGHEARFGLAFNGNKTITAGNFTVGQLTYSNVLSGTNVYTINSGTLTLNNNAQPSRILSNAASTGTQLINSNLNITGAFVAEINTNTLQVAGTVTGSNGMTKIGAGRFIVSGNNAGLSGALAVNGGIFEARGAGGNNGGFGAMTATVASGARAELRASGSGWTVTTNFTIAGTGPDSASALRFRNDNGGITHNGAINLTGNATMRVDAGNVGGGGVNLANNELRFIGNSGSNGNVVGVISPGPLPEHIGSIRVAIDTGGSVGLFANNTYLGQTNIDNGTLRIDRAASLGVATGAVTDAVVVTGANSALRMVGGGSFTVPTKLLRLDGGSLAAEGGNKTWNANVELLSGGTIRRDGTGALSIDQPIGFVTGAGQTLTLRPFDNGSVININGGIADSTGTGGVTIVAGSAADVVGRVNLNSTNTYSGNTVINAHTVYANATNSTGTGAVAVNGDGTTIGTLRGTGSIAGAVTSTGGVIAPGGDSTGTLTLNGGLTLNAASTYRARIVSNTSFDQALITGSTTLNGAILAVDLTGVTGPFVRETDQLYILRMAPGESLPAGQTFNLAEGTVVGSSHDFDFILHYDYNPGGGVFITPVPEPALVFGLAAGALGLYRLRRRPRLEPTRA